MPGWPGGLGNRLQDGRAAVDQGLGDRLQAEPGLIDQWKASLANRILSAPSKLFGGLVVDPAVDALTLAGDVIHGRQPTMAADPQTGEFHTDPRLADRAMNAAGMLTLGAGAVPAEANSLRMGIKAYHGSPHDFERFDASKIGTGEGAQAYGHGLYMAENPETASVYKEMLTAKHNPADQQSRRFLTGADENAPGEFFPEGTDFGSLLGAGEERASISNAELVKRSLEHLERVKKGKGPLHAAALQKAQATVDYLKNNPQARFTGAPYEGRMYEVDIAADPEHFLDWDKPLSEQSPQVREKLEKVRQAVPELWSAAGGLRPALPGQYVIDRLGKTEKGANALREAGIPGIRYLDQGSRTKGNVIAGDGKPTGHRNIDSMIANTYHSWDKFKAANPNPSPQLKAAIDELDARGGVKFHRDEGTHNYVVFPGNEHLIAILKKYGLPISAAGLAALSQLHPQEAQAQPLGDRLQRGSQ